jgi:uncharacterized protein YdaU (DUF1376 family)
MTPAEEGAYTHLLALAWNSRDCSLPDDDDALASLSRMGSDWIKSSEKIRKGFTAKGGRLYPKKLLELFKEASEVSESKTKGAEERWGKEKYFESELEAYQTLINDREWLSNQERYHPGLNVLLSLEKAHTQFWGSEAGWEFSKRKRSKVKNWKLQFANALSQKVNQVWNKKETQMRSFGRQELSMEELQRQAEEIVLS